jgi:hypothetical protein
MKTNRTAADPYRGTGRTTRQMEAAPVGAIFVWCNDHIDYAKTHTRGLGRADLKVVAPSWLQSDRMLGMSLTGIVVDHDDSLTPRQLEGVNASMGRIRRCAARAEDLHGEDHHAGRNCAESQTGISESDGGECD